MLIHTESACPPMLFPPRWLCRPSGSIASSSCTRCSTSRRACGGQERLRSRGHPEVGPAPPRRLACTSTPGSHRPEPSVPPRREGPLSYAFPAPGEHHHPPSPAAYARCRAVPLWDAGRMTEPVADATSDAPAERYLLRQKLTMMVNRYEIVRQDEFGKELGLLCFAE